MWMCAPCCVVSTSTVPRGAMHSGGKWLTHTNAYTRLTCTHALLSKNLQAMGAHASFLVCRRARGAVAWENSAALMHIVFFRKKMDPR